ncbi:MAG TPA: hypothetical protein VF240_20495 [Pyrinomonadaceae bacterium]
MNCESNERLLALHAGGDLSAGQASALSAHLRTCEDCRRLAADFAASRELLGTHEPPEFDAAFFDAVRRNVLREIDDAPPPPAFARLTALLFGRRALALAACVVFLFAAGALAPYLREGHRLTGDTPQQVADANGEAQQESDGPSVIDSPAIRDIKVKTTPAVKLTASSSPRRTQIVARATHASRAKRSERVERPPSHVSDRAVAAEIARAAGVAPTLEEAAPASEVAVLAAPAERKMLRIELQTGDPNVRIIWLTPQEPEKLPR